MPLAHCNTWRPVCRARAGCELHAHDSSPHNRWARLAGEDGAGKFDTRLVANATSLLQGLFELLPGQLDVADYKGTDGELDCKVRGALLFSPLHGMSMYVESVKHAECTSEGMQLPVL